MNLEKLRDKEYLKCTELLSELIGLDTDTEEKIYKCFQSMGITYFFKHLELVGLPQEASEKLKNVKFIIEVFDEKVGQE